jgi:beta-alanine degradation protein BauB
VDEETGGVVFREPGATHTLTNIGDTTYVARIVELKA